ncbi:MAG TPA: hypothetical protein ENJ84_04695 [Gammaproteobacteria bacterium]|nr:hypothetical protein [Gammaproteobacteria bacterium]
MTPDFEGNFSQIQAWAHAAKTSGWLRPDDIAQLASADEARVEKLFREHHRRPLIVAFFGGTGVGKSSLLNRLAGESVARVGIARPTSMEVTLYLHEDLQANLLPDELPTEHTRIAYHQQEKRRLVAWLDLPDIDSTERENEALVEAWLPFVDWIVYVVSPERYHDDMGWRFLQQRGHRHAWLFVMNHWDEGNETQIDDFRNKLVNAGFKDPLILRTSSAGPMIKDDFLQLEQTVNQAINQFGLELLQELGIQAHVEESRLQLEHLHQRLADTRTWREAESNWKRSIDQELNALKMQLNMSGTALTQSVLAQESLLKKKDSTPSSLLSANELSDTLWNPRNQARLQDLDIALINQLQASNLPFEPFAQRLEAQQTQVKKDFQHLLEDALNAAMAQPGTHLQRTLYKVTDSLSWMLPMGAAIWAIYHVIRTFYLGTQGELAFLGFNFAIHSGLLIGLGWLIPFILHRKLKPSLSGAVEQGVQDGIQHGIDRIKQHYLQVWTQTDRDRQQQCQQLEKIQSELDTLKKNSAAQLEEFVSHKI